MPTCCDWFPTAPIAVGLSRSAAATARKGGAHEVLAATTLPTSPPQVVRP